MAHKDPEKRREYMRKWHEANKERMREYREANKERNAAAQKAWREANKERSREYRKANAARTAASRKAWYETPAGRAVFLISNARGRARRARLPFDLDDHRDRIAEIVAEGRCKYSNIPFDLSSVVAMKNNPRAPSIDQIIPGKGYTWDNIYIVCWALNAAKSDWSLPILLEIMRSFVAHQDAKSARLESGKTATNGAGHAA